MINKNQKGQSSFEMLIGALVIMGLTIFILGNYFALSDSTIALSIMKIETVKELSKKPDNYTLDKITFTEPAQNTIRFELITRPYETTPTDIDLNKAIETITEKTKYNTIEIFINNMQII